jgi:hypothetical protein
VEGNRRDLEAESDQEESRADGQEQAEVPAGGGVEDVQPEVEPVAPKIKAVPYTTNPLANAPSRKYLTPASSDLRLREMAERT